MPAGAGNEIEMPWWRRSCVSVGAVTQEQLGRPKAGGEEHQTGEFYTRLPEQTQDSKRGIRSRDNGQAIRLLGVAAERAGLRSPALWSIARMHLTSKAGQKETPTITPTVPDGLLRCRSRLTEQTGRLRRIPGSGRQEKHVK